MCWPEELQCALAYILQVCATLSGGVRKCCLSDSSKFPIGVQLE